MAEEEKNNEEKQDEFEEYYTAEEKEYLESEVNLLSPQTPFMRDFLKLSMPLVIIFVVTILGGPALVFLAAENPDGTGPLTEATILWFPAHWFIMAWVVPVIPFILAIVFAIQQDKLWQKYGASGEQE